MYILVGTNALYNLYNIHLQKIAFIFYVIITICKKKLVKNVMLI